MRNPRGDAVGYSQLMAMDDVATVVALDRSRRTFRASVEAHRGRIVDMAGDSVLAVFDTALGAVRTAVAVQGELTGTMADVADDRRMRFRIGIHLGDIVEKPDGTIYGDGVNVAARLEGIAEPGSVVVSHVVQSIVDGKMPVAFIDLGPQTVKNIAQPVRAFRVAPCDAAPSSVRPAKSGRRLRVTTAAALALLVIFVAGLGWWRPWQHVPGAAPATRPLSIAVLPFANLSGDPGQAYVADGLTASVTSDLSRIRDAFVVSAAAAHAYKDKPVTLQQIGHELGVRYVLQGNVQKGGEHIRINASLGDTADNAQLWSDSFDGDTSDLFGLQDLITTRIGNSIGRTMVINAARDSEKRKTDPTAADLVLRATALTAAPRSQKNSWQIIQWLRRALVLEPDNARAQSALAPQLVGYANNYLADDDPAAEAMRIEGRDLALRIRQADPADPSPWLTLALYAGAHNDRVGMLRAREARLALEPKNPAAYFSVALSYVRDDPRRALALIDRAIDLDPRRSNAEFLAIRSQALLWSGDNDAAIATGRSALEQNEESTRPAYLTLAVAWWLKGDMKQAVAMAASYRRLRPSARLADQAPGPDAIPASRDFFDNQLAPAWQALGLPE